MKEKFIKQCLIVQFKISKIQKFKLRFPVSFEFFVNLNKIEDQTMDATSSATDYLNNLLIETYKDLLIEKEKMAVYLKSDLQLESKLLNECTTILNDNDKVIQNLKFDFVQNLKTKIDVGKNERNESNDNDLDEFHFL